MVAERSGEEVNRMSAEVYMRCGIQGSVGQSVMCRFK